MRSYIASRREQFIQDFQTIVNMDSGSGHASGIEQVARFFENRFTDLGLDARVLFPGTGSVPCLEARHTGKDRPFDVLLLGHMDTVFPKDEVLKRPFAVRDGKAFGPGVCDMKGGLLVVLHAMETLKHQGILDSLTVCVAFNGDEETGSHASKEWIMDLARQSRHTLVYEPCRPGYRCVIRRKGGGSYHVTVQGREAHAGADPEKGINAVVELAHQIVRIHGLNTPGTDTTVQVTVVSGGDKVNIIPGLAEARVDVRIARRNEKEKVETFFSTLNDHLLFPDSRISVRGNVNRPPMEPGPSTESLWARIQTIGRQMGLPMEAIATGGCSDGNYTSSAGSPTIDGMGIVGADSHTADEYADLESIEPMVELTARVCQTLSDREDTP